MEFLEAFYYWIFDLQTSVFCPIAAFLAASVLPAVSASVFTELGLFFQWVSILHDPSIFPVYLIVTLDIFAFSFLVNFIMRILRFISFILPGF